MFDFNPKYIVDGLNPFRKKWAIIIFMEFKNGKRITFKNFQSKYSISPSILSSTLKELTKEKLISRKAYGTIPPMRVEYKITSHGKTLMTALSHLIQWVYENKKPE